MNSKNPLLFRLLCMAALSTGLLQAQEKSKTFKETFNVGDDTVLELNTTHTNVEFETWDKNQVEIIATVELIDATDEEIAEYFKEDPVRIMGNSKAIQVSTPKASFWSSNFVWNDSALEGVVTDLEDVVTRIEPLFLDLEIPELEELSELPEVFINPPLPPLSFKQFDYEAYKKDGDKYLKEWTKEFREGFDEEYEEKLKAWGKAFEKRAKEREARLKKRTADLEKRAVERAEKKAEYAKQKAKWAEKRAKKLNKNFKVYSDNSFFSSDDSPNVFYLLSDGKSKKQKVKKTIKIKMPKSTRLKIDVKHGEIKLAATTKNINASLRYASLLANRIEGNQTNIEALYSPVEVTQWNYGQLKADYADHINLKEVDDLTLDATSSNISIDQLNKKAILSSNLGELVIHKVSKGFSDLDVEVNNGEFYCVIPKTAATFYINGTNSTISYPEVLQMEKTKSFDKEISKGFLNNANSGKRITVNSKYSQVVLKQ